MGFADSVKSGVSNVQKQVNDKIASIATELFTTAVELTPVSDPKYKKRGELINNWFLGVGSPNLSYTFSFDITGQGSLQRIAALQGTKEFLGKDGEVSIANTVPYGARAEYIGWPSPRWNDSKPYGMMRNALTIVASKYKG